MNKIYRLTLDGIGIYVIELFAVVKTVLAHPNKDSGRKFVGDFKVVG